MESDRAKFFYQVRRAVACGTPFFQTELDLSGSSQAKALC